MSGDHSRASRIIVAVLLLSAVCLSVSGTVLVLHLNQKKAALAELRGRVKELQTQSQFVGGLRLLSDQYLKGDLGHARDALIETIRRIENSAFSNAEMARLLRLPCSRLFVLDLRNGNNALADIDLVKTRYWFLRDLETGGSSETDISRGTKDLNPASFERFVTDADAQVTRDAGPAYLADLFSRSVPKSATEYPKASDKK